MLGCSGGFDYDPSALYEEMTFPCDACGIWQVWQGGVWRPNPDLRPQPLNEPPT